MTKHKLVEEGLLQEITSGRLAVGEQVATGPEVADKFGVSMATADRALVSLVSKGYLERTQGRGTFVTDWMSAQGQKRQADSISLVCSSEHINSSRFYADFMHSASVTAEENGYHLVFCASNGNAERLPPLIIRSKQALGNLILGGIGEDQARVLLAHNIPHLFVGNHRNTFGRPTVRYDLEDAAYQITTRLLELDRGPVWLVIEPSTVVHYSRELEEGYQQAVTEHPDPEYQVYLSGITDGSNSCRKLVERMIASGQEHFCMIVNQSHIGQVVQALGEAGIDMGRTTIVLVDTPEGVSRFGDRMSVCVLSAEDLAVESVRQIIAASRNGSTVAGKDYKLQIEAVNDLVKPFKFSWR